MRRRGSDWFVASRTIGVGTAERGTALERGTTHTRPRRTCSLRYGLQLSEEDWCGAVQTYMGSRGMKSSLFSGCEKSELRAMAERARAEHADVFAASPCPHQPKAVPVPKVSED